MATRTPTRPPRADQQPDDTPAPRGLAARVSLGRVFAPVPSEFLLISSTALLLTGFGLVMVLSATTASATAEGQSPFEALIKQGVFAMIGIPLMFVASRFPLRFWKKIAWPLLGFAVLFQLLVFVPGLGIEILGNRNWISIAGQTVQPSEFLKLSLALWVAYVLYRKQTLLGLWRHVFIPLVPVSAAVIATVMAGHDLGTAMILVLIVLGGLFFSGVRLRIFLLPLIAAAAYVAYMAVASPNRMRRIMSFMNEDCDYFNDCYQAMHGVFGLAGGGIFGSASAIRKRSTAGCRRARTTTSSRSWAKRWGSSDASSSSASSRCSRSAPSTSSARRTTRSSASPPAGSRCGSWGRR